MGTISEVGEAVEVIKSNGNDDIILLHCVSAYIKKGSGFDYADV